MSDEKKREIAKKGGMAAQASGKAHSWTFLEAQAAGRKGGKTSRRGKVKQSPEKVAAFNARIAEELAGGE